MTNIFPSSAACGNQQSSNIFYEIQSEAKVENHKECVKEHLPVVQWMQIIISNCGQSDNSP
ncbi:hypothetical protein Ancab_006924, partial [Ancistrocladus abbreviatus]